MRSGGAAAGRPRASMPGGEGSRSASALHEGLDDRLINGMKKLNMHLKDVELLPDGGGWLLVEFGGESKTESDANAPKVAYETVFRASKVKGMDVRNDHDENLGSVDELVIDVTKGHIKYVALSFGSWFTGGNKLFAVPLSSFTPPLRCARRRRATTVPRAPLAVRHRPW